MRQQHYLVNTLRDVPADADVASHQLMLRAGLIRQLAAGIYTYLPLGYKVLRNIQRIIEEEMDKTGAQQVQMPAIQPSEIWKETGRWDVYGPELLRLYDRHEREFALGPTHEEVITGLLRDEVNSYKRLPMTLYQVQAKYRDERRPRFGVLRSREFLMKDAYSFDHSQDGLAESYQKMYAAYMNIFERCGLDFRAVEADAGAIGGADNHEFMVLSEVGEDTIAYCDTCQYAANIEKAEVAQQHYDQVQHAEQEHVQKVDTPNVQTIDHLTQFLQVDAKQVIKTVAFDVQGEIVIALVRGDYDVNEVKVQNVLGAETIDMLSEARVHADLKSVPGFIGPAGFEGVKIVADYSVRGMKNAVIGANERDRHLIGVQPEKDFSVDNYADLRNIVEGDGCPRCEGTIQFAQGIEVGHVFKLGTKYSEAMKATFLDENGKARPMLMGCYGIGVSRTLAAIIEQHHDADGIIWPASVAPFDVHVIGLNLKDEGQKQVAEEIYETLQQSGFDCLFDDRDERPGVKFKDADLLGVPLRVTVGKKATEGIVECKERRSGHMEEVEISQLASYVQQRV